MSEAKVTVWTINADGTETPEKIRVMENSPVHHPECMDCGVDTDAINESYMVIDDLWRAAVPTEAGMLCVGCLEKRLGRTLQRKDFAKFCISAVDEGYAKIDGAAQHAPGFIGVRRFAPCAIADQAHGAVAEAVDGEIAADEKFA